MGFAAKGRSGRAGRGLRSGRALAVFAALAMVLARGAPGDANASGTVKVETVASALSWVSPLWGYHAPKIVRSRKGEIWAVNFFGRYADASAQI